MLYNSIIISNNSYSVSEINSSLLSAVKHKSKATTCQLLKEILHTPMLKNNIENILKVVIYALVTEKMPKYWLLQELPTDAKNIINQETTDIIVKQLSSKIKSILDDENKIQLILHLIMTDEFDQLFVKALKKAMISKIVLKPTLRIIIIQAAHALHPASRLVPTTIKVCAADRLIDLMFLLNPDKLWEVLNTTSNFEKYTNQYWETCLEQAFT